MLVPFSAGKLFEFRPENSFYEYNVVIKIEKGETINEIKYNASVRWLKKENNLHYFEIDRITDIFINEEEVNDMADLLAYKTSKVLYPLQISADRFGKYESVENLDVFNARWIKVKEQIYKDFEGELVDQYLGIIENKLENPEIISELINNDYFIRTLFFGVYQMYGKSYKIGGEDSFPIVKNIEEPIYKIEIKIDPLLDEYNLVHITGKGILHDQRTRNDFINENPFSNRTVYNEDGNFRLQYYMNAKTGMSEFIYLECDIALDEKKTISVAISNIDQN